MGAVLDLKSKIISQYDFDYLEAMFKCSSTGMSIASLDGRFLKVNEVYAKMLGFTVEELEDLDYQAITLSDDLEESKTELNKLISGEKNSVQLKKRYIGKNNKLVHALTSVFIVRDRFGENKYFVAQVQDVTAAKTKELEDKILLDNINDGYWDWRIKENYEYMSPKFWEILGHDHREKKHHPDEWKDLIFPEDLKRALSAFEKHVETKGRHPYYLEVRYKHKNGSTVWVLCRGTVVEWDGDEPVRMCGSHTDITLLKQYEVDLEKEKKKRIHQSQLSAIG